MSKRKTEDILADLDKVQDAREILAGAYIVESEKLTTEHEKLIRELQTKR